MYRKNYDRKSFTTSDIVELYKYRKKREQKSFSSFSFPIPHCSSAKGSSINFFFSSRFAFEIRVTMTANLWRQQFLFHVIGAYMKMRSWGRFGGRSFAYFVSKSLFSTESSCFISSPKASNRRCLITRY